MQINLLPWREQEREKQKKQFLYFAGACMALSLFIIILIHIFFLFQQRIQKNRIQFLRTTIEKEQLYFNELLSEKSQSEAWEKQLNFLVGLRKTNYGAIVLLNDLNQLVPNTISLNSVTRQDKKIVIQGVAKTDLQITFLMKKIASSIYFTDLQLSEISTQKGAHTVKEGSRFQLQMMMKD